jgi:hypothetical protein
MNQALLLIWIQLASQAYNLPEGLLSAVCYVESTHKVDVGRVHDGGSLSHGPCQIKLIAARTTGFQGTAVQLDDVFTGVIYAASYLRYQIDRYHDPIKAVAAYNAGKYRGVNGKPKNYKYVNKVMAAWKQKR